MQCVLVFGHVTPSSDVSVDVGINCLGSCYHIDKVACVHARILHHLQEVTHAWPCTEWYAL